MKWLSTFSVAAIFFVGYAATFFACKAINPATEVSILDFVVVVTCLIIVDHIVNAEGTK